MTSYQNVSESQIPGYNDCPVLDFSKKSDSSTSLAAKKRRRPVLNHHASSSSQTSLSSASSSSQIPSKPLLAPKKSEAKLVPPPPRSEETQSQAQAQVSTEQVLQKLNELLETPTTLPANEFNHYSKRLRDSVSNPSFKNEYKQLIHKTLTDLKEGKESVKDDLVRFMFSNDGTSSWCQPLKKVIENQKL